MIPKIKLCLPFPFPSTDYDPKWQAVGNVYYLIDAFDASHLAYWSERFKKVHFHEIGYMSPNPRVDSEVVFHYDPEYEPFRVEGEKNNLIFFFLLFSK